MVKIWMVQLPHRLISVQLKAIAGSSKGQKLNIKSSFFYLPNMVLLLTTLLGLASASTSRAQPASAQTAAQSGKWQVRGMAKARQPRALAEGNQVSLNGRTLPAAWNQWQPNANPGKVHTTISDAGVSQLLGVELLDTNNPAQQPVQWFSPPKTALILPSQMQRGYRYLDITQLATRAGWQFVADGNTLRITTPGATVKEIRQGKQPWGDRLVIDLDRPAVWQIGQQPLPPKPKLPPADPQVQILPPPSPPNQTWLLTIAAATGPAMGDRFQLPNSLVSTTVAKLETSPNLTKIHLSIPPGLSPRISTLINPNRLVIDLRPDALVERNILWYPGLRWRQQFVKLDASRFPLVWLETNPRAAGVQLKPIWSEATSLIGIAPIIETAQRYAAVAAINGGFFNRNNQYPLGALRQDGRWLSSPILNRGAIAWNEAGQVKIGRLNLQSTLTTSTGKRLLILTHNSGYVQPGIALYSPAWGLTYTPLIDNEIVVVVQNNQVTTQIPGGGAGKAAISIPRNGYLLALRNDRAAVDFLPIGTLLRQANVTQPVDFASYSQIIGAGPLLLQNRQIVLDAEAEGFSDAFIRQQAMRSAICTTPSGNLLIATVHNRVGGAGPTLAEVARVMQQLGCIDALNLDGGSSASLYLGGQLLNRSPRTAARVHNGLGIFISDE